MGKAMELLDKDVIYSIIFNVYDAVKACKYATGILAAATLTLIRT